MRKKDWLAAAFFAAGLVAMPALAQEEADEPPPRRGVRGPMPDWIDESWLLRRHIARPWALMEVNVIDIRTGELHAGVNIVVRGDVIDSISRAEPPRTVERVNGDGAFVIPGFFDLHAHVMPEWDAYPDALSPQETLRALLDAGVTTIRLIPLYGESAAHFAAEAHRGAIAGPTIVPASSVFEQEPGRTSFGFGDPQTARAWVQREALVGSRWIKVYDNMDEPSLRAIIETAREYGMRICGHATIVPPHRASELGMHCIEHSVGLPWSCLPDEIDVPEFETRFDEIGWYWAHAEDEKLEALINTWLENETAWVPTLVVSEKIVELGGHDETPFADENTSQRLDAALKRAAELAVSLHRRSGLVGLGTDFPINGVEPGASVHREMQLLVERGGATPLEALQMATISSARILGHDSVLGAVEPGRLANFVVLRANPLEDITRTLEIEFTVHDGRIHRTGE